MRVLMLLLVVGGCYRDSTPARVDSPAVAPAAPKADRSAARDLARRFARAATDHDRGALRSTLATKVLVVQLELPSAACQEKFGGVEREIKSAELDELAECLADLPDLSSVKAPTIKAKGDWWIADLALECTTYKLMLTPMATGPLAIAGVGQASTCAEGGVVGGVYSGVYSGAPPPPPPPPPPSPPTNVPPTLLEGNRIAGNKLIVPEDADKLTMQQSGKDRVIGSFKLCLDATGAVSAVTQLKSTGLPGYDAKIQNEIQASWRYRPYLVNGKPVPVCTAVTFIYSRH